MDCISHISGILGILVLSLHYNVGSVLWGIFEGAVCRTLPSFSFSICPRCRISLGFLNILRHIELQLVVNNSKSHSVCVRVEVTRSGIFTIVVGHAVGGCPAVVWSLHQCGRP